MTHSTQCYKRCLRKFARRPKKVPLGSENDEKKNIFPQDNPMDTWNPILTNLLSDKKSFPFILQKRQKSGTLRGKNSSKYSWGHVECSLGNPVKRKFDKRPKTFRWLTENCEQTLLSKTNDSPQNDPMVTLIAVLTTLQNKFEKMPSSFRSIAEKLINFFPEKRYISKSSYGHGQRSFGDPIGKFGTRSQMFSLSVLERWKSLVYWKKLWKSSSGT